MKKDPKIFLRHILESIEAIEKYLIGVSEDKFLQATQIQDAVVRRLEIIGEATKNLPKSFKDRYPAIPWKKMAGMRDVLIHEYFGVNKKLVWKVIKREIPKIKKKILVILQKFNP